MNPYARHKARSLALQALYEWQFMTNSIADIEMQHFTELNPKKVDIEYFRDLLRNTTKNIATIDKIMTPFLDRQPQDLSLVERAILRLAVYELTYRLDVPYKVVINEALDLDKKFGTIEGYKYVNGVLDKVARSVRAIEISKSC